MSSEKLGTICDQKSSWDRLEGQHEGQQAWRFTSTVFQTDDAPGMYSSTVRLVCLQQVAYCVAIRHVLTVPPNDLQSLRGHKS